jgi:hypothetical protein
MKGAVRILTEGGEIDLRAGVRRKTVDLWCQGQTVGRLRWEDPPSAVAYLDIEGRCYEVVGTRRRTRRRGLEAWWAGEAVARLDIGMLGQAKRVTTRSGGIYEFRRTGSGVVLERGAGSEPAMTIGRRMGAGRRTYRVHVEGTSEEELGAVVGVVLVYMVWNDQGQTIGALGAGVSG